MSSLFVQSEYHFECLDLIFLFTFWILDILSNQMQLTGDKIIKNK